jgi:ABC-2 type transport system permease protein
MKLPPILLVARRDYLAYVGAWGFWISLITAPLILAVLMFAPVLVARAEPPRALMILAEQAPDAVTVADAFRAAARRDARGEVAAYVDTAAPATAGQALAAYDAAPDRDAAIAAAREIVRAQAPRALGAFPQPSPRYVLADPPPGAAIEALRPQLSGDEGALYGALNIRRDAVGAPLIEYWSINLSHDEPMNIARAAMRMAMQREALAAQGVDPSEADRLNDLNPQVAQFDPRAQAGGGEVTLRERAPFYAALALTFLLWSVVFSVANMLLNGMIEEKSNKILDTLLTSVTPMQLLAGKLIGVAAVSATLFLFWGALGGGLLSLAADRGDSIIGQIAAAFLEPRLLAAFAIGFVAGYIIYGAIFLALGSLCESIQEAQTLLGPVAMVLAVPMVLVTPALDNPNAPIVEGASWIPLFTPFLMLVRAPVGLSWGEIAGMAALMFVTAAVILFVSARVFRAGVVDQLTLNSWRAQRRNA